MECPQCNVEMEELADEQLALKRCGGCKGLWTDVAELNRILLHNNLPGLETLGGRPNVEDMMGQCPECQVDLVSIEGGPRHALHYDTCESCGGIWIEPEGEVASAGDAIDEIVGFFKRFQNHAA